MVMVEVGEGEGQSQWRVPRVPHSALQLPHRPTQSPTDATELEDRSRRGRQQWRRSGDSRRWQKEFYRLVHHYYYHFVHHYSCLEQRLRRARKASLVHRETRSERSFCLVCPTKNSA